MQYIYEIHFFYAMHSNIFFVQYKIEIHGALKVQNPCFHRSLSREFNVPAPRVPSPPSPPPIKGPTRPRVLVFIDPRPSMGPPWVALTTRRFQFDLRTVSGWISKKLSFVLILLRHWKDYAAACRQRLQRLRPTLSPHSTGNPFLPVNQPPPSPDSLNLSPLRLRTCPSCNMTK